MVLADTGEDVVMVCDKCDFAANVESTPVVNSKSKINKKDYLELDLIDTPSLVSVAEVAEFLQSSRLS